MTDFKNAKELLALCHKNHQRVSDVMRQRECELGEVSMDQACGRMRKVLEVMRQSAQKPIKMPQKSMGGLIGGEARMLDVYQGKGSSVCGKVDHDGF